MRISLRAQGKRFVDWRKKRKQRGAQALGVWSIPHAVGLSDPFTTACGLSYNFGAEVPNAYRDYPPGGLATTFEALDIRQKCLGCAGAIGGDPTV